MKKNSEVTVTLSRIERMLNAFAYVSRKAVKLNDATDKYLAIIKDGLSEERSEGYEIGYARGYARGYAEGFKNGKIHSNS